MLTASQQDNLLILDFGSQYAQLIARRIRELGVYCEVHRYDADASLLETLQPRGIILSGGPESVTKKMTPRAPDWVFTANLPLLGICYGMQTMATQLGGEVSASMVSEFGQASLHLIESSVLFSALAPEETTSGNRLSVWMSHGDHVTRVPAGFHVTARTTNVPISAMECPEKKWFAVQFHPEVTHTPCGAALLSRFAYDICGCQKNWTLDTIIETQVQKIKAEVGDKRVILALSGGVDSSVAALLLTEAIGANLTCIFVDTGLLRDQEAEQVVAMFEAHYTFELIVVDAKTRYFKALAGLSDPEEKRQCIGRLFIEIFEEEAARLDHIEYLAQGTIYPDVIESAGGNTQAAHVIKSHHNVGGLPDNMRLKVIEPLRELFKDEVRRVGLQLGLPHAMLYRHPFPGPGLAVRILGEVQPAYVAILQRADAIFIAALREYDLYDCVSQAFAVFLPIKSVAVTGDARRYAYVIALRAVETIDFMTATWARLPDDFLAEVSLRICNEVPDVSRVVYDISGKPPATIEWE